MEQLVLYINFIIVIFIMVLGVPISFVHVGPPTINRGLVTCTPALKSQDHGAVYIRYNIVFCVLDVTHLFQVWCKCS